MTKKLKAAGLLLFIVCAGAGNVEVSAMCKETRETSRMLADYNLAENLGACTGLENAELLKTVGGAFVETNVGFLMPEASDDEFAANLAKARTCPLPIKCANSFYPGSIKLVGPDVDTERVLRYAEKAFERAEQVGIEIIVLGSGDARRIPEGFSRAAARQQFIDLMKTMAPLAKKHGVTIVLEPLYGKASNFINSVREGTIIAREVGHPNVCVLADFFHMTQEGEGPDAIIDAGATLRHCHIAENDERTPPGVKGDDFRPFFEALESINYQGRLSIESNWPGGFDALIGNAMDTMKEQIQTSGK